MARTKSEKKAERDRWKDTADTQEDYPYGLSISLDHAAIEKLGVADCEADDKVDIVAVAMVSRAQTNTINGKKRRSMTLQIQKMQVDKGKTNSADAETVLYEKG